MSTWTFAWADLFVPFGDWDTVFRVTKKTLGPEVFFFLDSANSLTGPHLGLREPLPPANSRRKYQKERWAKRKQESEPLKGPFDWIWLWASSCHLSVSMCPFDELKFIFVRLVKVIFYSHQNSMGQVYCSQMQLPNRFFLFLPKVNCFFILLWLFNY